MPKRLKQKRRHKQTGAACDTQECEAVRQPPNQYASPVLMKDVDYSLEKEALQHILDSVLRLQTYIALRERRR